jgi:hypothetical protein
MQFHRIEPYLHAMRLRVFGNRTIGRKQGQLGVAERPFIKDPSILEPIELIKTAV